MQCSPPPYGFSYPNPTQLLPCNPVIPPEIIGEGEVTSVMLPDGSVQFIFLPITKRWPNYIYNENVYNPYWRANTEVWLVRSFSKQTPQAAFNQCWQPMNVEPYSKLCFNPNCNLKEPGFQLKFHNDSWTSTTDLHYFYPCIRKYNWYPLLCAKESKSVQVEIPIEEKYLTQNSKISCNPCHCTPTTSSHPSQNTTAFCKCCHCTSCVETKENIRKKDQYGNINQCSDMSIDGTNQSYNLTKSRNTHKTKKKSSKGVTIRDSPRTMDKSVTTYADVASNCVTDKKEQTKTCCCGPPSVSPLRKVRSAPRREISNPNKSNIIQNQSSEQVMCTYDSCSCANSFCNCDTDAENW